MPLNASRCRPRSSRAAFADAVRSTLAELGVEHLDAVVHNAGAGVFAPFTETTEEQLDQLVAEHLKAPFFLTQALLPLLADGGRILNVSSGLARFTGPGFAAYAIDEGTGTCRPARAAPLADMESLNVLLLRPGAAARHPGLVAA